MGDALPYKGVSIFLALTGVALIVAWLPDIINSLVSGRPLGRYLCNQLRDGKS